MGEVNDCSKSEHGSKPCIFMGSCEQIAGVQFCPEFINVAGPKVVASLQKC